MMVTDMMIRRGFVGILCLMLGIMASIVGGYVLNAETVQTCETQWDYVTDISGAFVGSNADMEIDYSPPANSTGWSYASPYNQRYISAVEWDRGPISLYSVYPQAPQVLKRTITVSATNLTGVGTAGYEIREGGSVLRTGDMGIEWGQRNSTVVTAYRYGSESDQVLGAFGVPMSEVIAAIGSEDYTRMELHADNDDGYPAFARIYSTSLAGPFDGYENVAVAFQRAVNHSSDAAFAFASETLSIGGVAAPVGECDLVFGFSQKAGAGASSGTMTLTVSMITDPPVEYMDVSKGVRPISGTYTTVGDVEVVSDGSYAPHGTISFTRPGSAYAEMTFLALDDGEPSWTEIVVEGEPYSSGWALRVTHGSDSVNFTVQDSTAAIEFSVSSGVVRIIQGGQTRLSASLHGDLVLDIKMDTEASTAAFEATVYNDRGEVQRNSAPGVWWADLGYTYIETGTISHAYQGACWSNGEENLSVTLAFASLDPSQEGTYLAAMSFDVIDGVGGFAIVSRDSDGDWSFRYGQTVQDFMNVHRIGRWTALEVEIGPGGVKVTPITRFVSFTDYDKLGAPTLVLEREPALITGISMSSFAAEGMNPTNRVAVVATTVHLAEGGLYLQDGRLDVLQSFPGTDAFSLMIGSAAHIGTGITVSSGSRSATIPVNEKGQILVGERWADMDGATLRWYSPSGPSVGIGGTTYRPAIYYNGGVYDAGTVWLETKQGMTPVLTGAASDWSVTLDGVWAPAMFMYAGSNVASERTELADIGKAVFGWSGSDFVIVAMGVSIVACLGAGYLGYMSWWDWLALGTGMVVLWVML